MADADNTVDCETIRNRARSEVAGIVQNYVEVDDAIAVTVWKDSKSGRWTITATFARSE